jgi:hypothetical protein
VTPQELLTEIDAHGFTDTDTTEKLSAINASIRYIANRKAWPWMQKVWTLTFDGTNPYPSSSVTDLRAALKLIDTNSGRRIRYKSIDELEEQYGSTLTQSGDPFFYYFEGTQLRLWQVPGATQTLRLRGIRFHPTVAQNDPESAILVPAENHELILFRSLMRLNDLEDDNDLAARWGGLFDKGFEEMAEGLSVQQLDQPEHILVVDDDDYNYD